MSSFITKDDYKYHIRTFRLDQILEEQDEDEDLILDMAENDAISLMRDSLAPAYNVDIIFGATGDARHKTLLRWAKILVLYFIYERVPDDLVPERIVDNYKHVLKQLEAIEKGNKNLAGLPLNSVTGNNGESKPVTRRRWGSLPARSNDGGSPGFLK